MTCYGEQVAEHTHTRAHARTCTRTHIVEGLRVCHLSGGANTCLSFTLTESAISVAVSFPLSNQPLAGRKLTANG